MDIQHGFWDIPNCITCDRPDGIYPGPIQHVSTRRRDTIETIGEEQEEKKEEEEEEEKDDLEKKDLHVLEPRVDGKATRTSKKVMACGGSFGLGRDWRYPAFPSVHSYGWEGIENGAWDSISRYWGNVSDSCSSWAVSGRTRHDTRWVFNNGNPTQIRANYQSMNSFPCWLYRKLTIISAEHVFEGQLIGDFFDLWLNEGKIKNQRPAPASASSKFSCADSREYFLRARPAYPWLLGRTPGAGGSPTSFMNLLLSELGSINRLDRLTIMLARPNGKKGSVSS